MKLLIFLVLFLTFSCSSPEQHHKTHDAGPGDSPDFEVTDVFVTGENQQVADERQSGGNDRQPTSIPQTGCCLWHKRTCVQPCKR
jgi:hypothetical protein